MNAANVKQIDLDELIRAKNPALLRWLPSFMLNYMKRIVHQDEFNAFLVRARNAHEHDFVRAAIHEFGISIHSTGLENIPETGGCILACNHPLGGLDGIAVMHEAGRIRKDIKALVNDILMNLDNLSPLLIAVNKHGKNAAAGIRMIDQAYASEGCTIVFPAGLVSRKRNGKIEDSEWKKSFITRAIRYKRTIIPVYVGCTNSNFFYNLASLRTSLGIAANLEMFYLVNETYKQKGKSLRLVFGQPISPGTFTEEHSDHYWAQEVKKQVYALGERTNIKD